VGCTNTGRLTGSRSTIDNITACWWSPVLLNTHVLAQFRDRSKPANFKEMCDVAIAYTLPIAQRSQASYTCLTSQKPTSRHNIINYAPYTDHKVSTSRSVVGSCRLQSELRLIRSSWVGRWNHRLLSAQGRGFLVAFPATHS